MNERQTQVDLIRAHFERGGSLTTLEAMHAPFNSCALSQRCGDLARDKYPIKKEWITLPSGKRVRRYSKEVDPLKLESL